MSELQSQPDWMCPVCQNTCECSKCKKTPAVSTKKSPHLRLGGRASTSDQTETADDKTNFEASDTQVDIGGEEKETFKVR